MSKLYTVNDIAKAAGCSGSTIKNLLRDGDLKAGKVAGTRRFWEEEEAAKAVLDAKAALLRRKEDGHKKRSKVMLEKARETAKRVEPPAPPAPPAPPPDFAAQVRTTIVGSETVVAALENLQHAMNSNASAQAHDFVALRTGATNALAVQRDTLKVLEALLAEVKALRKDMNDAFEASIERAESKPAVNSEYAEAV